MSSATIVAPNVGSALPTGPSTPRTARDPLYDNVRFVAAVLVVMAHVLDRIADGPLADMLWSGTWAFRIPVYVFVAGWFTAMELDRARFGRLLVDVLLVYLALDLVGSVQRWAHEGVWAVDPWLPAPGMWFLMSLFLWRLVLPLALRVAGAWTLAWSVAASVAAGLLPALDVTWSAGRTVALFPLFVLGALARRDDVLDRVRQAFAPSRTHVAAAASALVVLAGVAGLSIADRSFYLRGPYPEGLDGQLGGAVERLFLLALATLGVGLLLALVPRRPVPVMTYVGSGSFYVYLLHMVLLTEVIESGFFDRIDSAPEQVATMAGAAVVAVLLGSRPVRALARPLVQPRRFVESLRQRLRATSSTAP